MNIIKPKSLKPGDTISIIAPSGNVDTDKIFAGKKYFEDKGFNVKLGKNIDKPRAYLSACDAERLEDLHNAFSDDETDAIICARGGYGALRLVDKIDYKLIKNNPKIFCGYSDITVLNTMFLINSGLITFSGPMIQGDFAPEQINEYTENCFFKTLTDNNTVITATNIINYSDYSDSKGILIGGNLSTFTSMCGNKILPDEKFIFFTEDLNEPVYKIDRYLTQLINIPEFKNNVGAILIGDLLGIEKEYEKDLDNLLKETSNELKTPILKGFPFSHSKIKATVPVGAYAVLNNNQLIISDYLA